MSESKHWGDPIEFAAFEKLLSEKSMFLIDERPKVDASVVYRCRKCNQVEKTYVKRHQANQWKPEFKVFVEGDYWGSLNKKLFDDIPALAQALRERGLTQVGF
ncbi:hypothetical protein PS918_02458 [Pseudomonas fluorescens]|uniref:Uncharacterized protein n=1 Tax=Pseudomonas fluorescens TaxID=294 RepID=A0A5E7S7Q5_PSEFL|nr:hypothetical protein [Pseudomonas fluorescens]VVP82711.1 hypothetical protein PS918_02458 [Pseudomonas fluorescens]